MARLGFDWTLLRVVFMEPAQLGLPALAFLRQISRSVLSFPFASTQVIRHGVSKTDESSRLNYENEIVVSEDRLQSSAAFALQFIRQIARHAFGQVSQKDAPSWVPILDLNIFWTHQPAAIRGWSHWRL